MKKYTYLTRLKKYLLKKKASDLPVNLRKSLLNIEMEDIHHQINFLKKKIKNSINKLIILLPEDTVLNILKFQENLRQRYLSSNEAQNSRKIGFITKIYDNNNIPLEAQSAPNLT